MWLFINNSSENIKLSVYPNPTNGLVNINLSEVHSHIHVEVINLTGQVIEAVSFENQQNISFNFESNPGIYILEVKTEKGSSVTQLILK